MRPFDIAAFGCGRVSTAVLSAVVALWLPLSVQAQEPDPQSASAPESEEVAPEVKSEEKTSRKPRFLLRLNSKNEHREEAEAKSENDEPKDDVDSVVTKRKGRKNRDAEPMAESSEMQPEEQEPAVADSVWYADAHIEFDETVWDFGDVARKGGDVVKNFDFVNDGSKPLVITGITMSCTCIKVDYPKRPVAAGKRGTIKLIYEPHKMSPGAFYRVVQVHSNSIDGVRLLTVSGNSVDARRLD